MPDGGEVVANFRVEHSAVQLEQVVTTVTGAQRTAELGRLMIGEVDAAGLGFAKDAIRRLVAFGTQVLGLRTIYVDVFATNVRSITGACAASGRMR